MALLYYDLDLNALIEGVEPYVPNPLTSIEEKRGTAPPYRLQFGRKGADGNWAPELLDPATVIRYGPKLAGEYDGAFMAFAGGPDWTRPVDATGFYTANPNFNTDELNGELGSPDSTTANDVPRVTLMAEISLRVGTAPPTKSKTFTVIVVNSVDSGNETAPTPAGPDLDARITALETTVSANHLDRLRFLTSTSGYIGSASTDLDSIPTASLLTPQLACFVHASDGLRWYLLSAGTDAEASPAVIRPDDYNSSTNAKVWKSVL